MPPPHRRLFQRKDKDEVEVAKVRFSEPISDDHLPKRSFESSSFAASIKAAGVEGLFAGDRNHSDKNVSAELARQVVAFNPDLLFVEGARDKQDSIERITRRSLVPGLSEGTDVVAADWKFSEKAEIANHAALLISKLKVYEEYGAEKYTDNLSNHGLLKSLRESNGNISDALSKTQILLYRSEDISEALDKRLGYEGEKKVADLIVDKIYKFYKQEGRVPTFVISYGAGHFESSIGIDELVQQGLAKKGLDMKTASLDVIPGKSDGKVEFVGREEDGKGTDYAIIVKKAATKNRFISTESQENMMSSALILANFNSGTRVNKVISALNELDDAAVKTGKLVHGLFGDYSYVDNQNIEKVHDSLLVSDVLSDKGIKKLNKLGEEVLDKMLDGKFNKDWSSSKVNALKDIDKAHDKMSAGIVENANNAEARIRSF